ncbi:hypothetical protein lse_0998 [Listeria seeligeri serovar 1/2b str. SLCC3954]|nr:hypothetical protein lse_0998 [Listeria seeligeri serovar 1/2b str. SLCC3954]
MPVSKKSPFSYLFDIVNHTEYIITDKASGEKE